MSKFQQGVMRQVLDDAEASLRMGNVQRAMHVIFVWAQRKDYLLAGSESWEDQNIGPIDPVNYALPDFMVNREPRPSLNDVLDDHIDNPARPLVPETLAKPIVAPPDVLAALGDDEAFVAHAVPERKGL